MQALHRLTYYSRNAIPGSRADLQEHIRQILATSRRNNVRSGLTGALMFNSGCFAQILEGPRSGIEETFERIQRDPRHGSVTVLEYAPAPARSFPNWSMAFVGEDADDAQAFGHVAAASAFDPARLTAETVFEALCRLVREEEKAA